MYVNQFHQLPILTRLVCHPKRNTLEKEKKRIFQKTRGKGGMNDKEEREEQKEEENLKQREKEKDEYSCRGGKGKLQNLEPLVRLSMLGKEAN